MVIAGLDLSSAPNVAALAALVAAVAALATAIINGLSARNVARIQRLALLGAIEHWRVLQERVTARVIERGEAGDLPGMATALDQEMGKLGYALAGVHMAAMAYIFPRPASSWRRLWEWVLGRFRGDGGRRHQERDTTEQP